jgi:hypothetical protein
MVFGMLLVPGGSTTPPVPPVPALTPVPPVPPVAPPPVAGVPAPAAVPPLAWPPPEGLGLLSELLHATGAAKHNVVTSATALPRKRDFMMKA